ncbi:MAG: PAS domain S-box protein [Acidobacteriota bacterium]|nr:PAS domain S-box protein [Acidobacteriota bacterium]
MIEPGLVKKKPYQRLAEINRAITSSLNFDEVLDLIVENAAQLVGTQVCLLLLVDPDENLRIRAASGVSEDLVRQFSGRMEEDVLTNLRTSLDIGAGQTLITVPVIAKKLLNGLLVVTRETPLTPDEHWQLSALADQAAIALRNARLYEIELAEARDASEIARNLLASIVESSQDAIISKDLNGIINSWNKGAERIFGFEAAEVIGQPITILIPPHLQNEEGLILERIRRGERIEHFDTIRRRKDGGLINISLTISPIKNERGQVVGASKIARDITEREQAQREIRFQANLLDAVEQAVIATDLTGTIIYWNSFAEKLYGWPAAEALGSNILEITPTKLLRNQAQEILLSLQKGQGWSGEFIVQRRDGSEFPAMVTDSPIFSEQGELIGIVGVSVDNTERRRAEEEREQLLTSEREARAEAEAANRLKDEFLATLSHELRNPLNVVIGYAEILRRGDEPPKPEFVIKAADVIRRNALAQSHLVSDLLDLSRLQMRKLSLNRQPVSLSTVMSDAIETVRAEASAKGVSLNVDLQTQILVVDGDPTRLGQIAWNLLNNSLKFTPAGGHIEVVLSEDGNDARLVVKDSGQGISEEFLPHVFEIFRQGDASSVRRQGGMGIGLALVKQLVELHGGRIVAESAGIGGGAQFTVWIPLHKLAFSPSSEKTGGTGALGNKFILVVDDSRETTEMLGKLLELEGAFVETARSGAEALQISKAKRFDLVISDISMPEMDGYQLLNELRKLPEMADVPAVALTGYGRNTDVKRTRDEGFAEHLTKPLDLDRLLQIVRKLTE